MKETYERTELQVTQFEAEDVITTSFVQGDPVTGGSGSKSNDLPFMPNSGGSGGVYM
ncbi:MAG: hypothetical protein IJJ15_07735 [Ruminococcus sp.]|nr:hypothetical protein [Ruminococcus sp.]